MTWDHEHGKREDEAAMKQLLHPCRTDGDEAKAIYNMLKAIMGAGGFALPWAFARMGLACSGIAIAASAVLGLLTVRELAALKQHVELQQNMVGATYVDVAQAALGPLGATAVYGLSVACSVGVTSAYLVFVVTTMQSLFPGTSYSRYLFLAVGFVLPATWLRDFSLLSRLSQSGTAAVVLGYLVTLHSGHSVTASPTAVAPLLMLGPQSWQDLAQGFGPVAFLFCIHFLLFPVMTASRSSTSPGRFVQLATIAFLTAGAANLAFAYACLAFFWHPRVFHRAE
mmetsp:Transcript_9709/g.23388  ORF Transcript_9709/g.23388 Transcript_9709/m.23388 type:complete len:283 (+) Transcript_9709:54-902(+)